MSKKRSAKDVKAMHDAALELNSAVLRYRGLTAINKGLPNYEFMTSADGTKRMPKTVSHHPTKKVSKSEKKRKIEQETTQALVNLRNAQNKFRAAEEKVYS